MIRAVDAIDSLREFWSKESLERDKEGLRLVNEAWPASQSAFLGSGFDRDRWAIHKDLRPVPYLGDLRRADIVLLLLNPQVHLDDYLTNADERFRARLEDTLGQPNREFASPCLALDVAYWWTSWFRWYEPRLREPVLEAARYRKCSYLEVLSELAQRTAILQLLPYYGNQGGSIPMRIINSFDSSKYAREAAAEIIRTSADQDRFVVMWWAAEQWGLGLEENDHFRILKRGRQQIGKKEALRKIYEKLISKHLHFPETPVSQP